MLITTALVASLTATLAPSTAAIGAAESSDLQLETSAGPFDHFRESRQLVARGTARFKPLKGNYPIGSWRNRVGLHKVKVVVMYSQDLDPLQDTIRSGDWAARYWAEEVPGMNFRFSRPTVKQAPFSVICNPSRAWKSASGTKRLGRNKHVLVVAPECEGRDGLWGYGQMGRGSGRAYVTGNYGEYFAHELGHNLGLPHENGLTCFGASGQRVPLSKRCTEEEYGDDGTLMGSGGRLGPTGQALLTRSAYRIKKGTSKTVTISNVGGPGRRVAVIKGSLGNLLFDMSPGSISSPQYDPGGLQARLVTRDGSGLLTLPDRNGQMSEAADSVLQTGESWVIPGTGMRATVLDFQAERYVRVRFSRA